MEKDEDEIMPLPNPALHSSTVYVIFFMLGLMSISC